MKGRFRVEDCEFNRYWHPALIGRIYDNPPSYLRLEVLDSTKELEASESDARGIGVATSEALSSSFNGSEEEA